MHSLLLQRPSTPRNNWCYQHQHNQVLSLGAFLVSEDVGDMGRNCRRGLLEKYHLSLTTPVCVATVKLINAFITTRHFSPPHCDDALCTSSSNPIMLEILLVVARTASNIFGKFKPDISYSFNHSLSTVIFISSVFNVFAFCSQRSEK